MGCVEDVISCFRQLKSYERIWVMCKLQHSCLPFELRFLGTCLEELGRKDFYEFRQIENDVNSAADLQSQNLGRFSDSDVQKKLVLYIALLNSTNYTCSNTLYKILANVEEVNTILKDGIMGRDKEAVERILMIYTLAVNHPAFSYEQKRVLQNIFSAVKSETSKLKQFDHEGVPEGSHDADQENATQECQSSGYSQVDEEYRSSEQPQLQNSSQYFTTIPTPYANDLPVHLHDPLNITMPTGPGYVRYAIPIGNAAQLMPNGWTTGMPVAYSEQNCVTTQPPLVSSIASASSKSETSSRCTSPSIQRARPLSAPYMRTSQINGPTYTPSFVAGAPNDLRELLNKDGPPHILLDFQNYTPEQLYSITDDELSEIGLSDDNVQQIREIINKFQQNAAKNGCSENSSPTRKTESYNDLQTEGTKRYINGCTPVAGIFYNAPMTTNPDNLQMQPMLCSPLNPCQFCLADRSNQFNGVMSVATDDMRAMRLDPDRPNCNSNSSNSDTTSSDHSPPNTPNLGQTSYDRNNGEAYTSKWTGSNDDRSPLGDSSGEEKKIMAPPPPPNNSNNNNNRGKPAFRGRSKGPTGNFRGRGSNFNNRRQDENRSNGGNSTDEQQRKQFIDNGVNVTPYSSNCAPNNIMTNSSFIHHQPHYIRSYPSFAPGSFIRPAPYPFPPNGDIMYHHFPPPGTAFIPAPPNAVPYSPTPVIPKLSCYNCGSQNHVGQDCSEATIDEVSKNNTFHIDFTPPPPENTLPDNSNLR